MHVVADALTRPLVVLAADLPDEFSGPVDYSGQWMWWAIAAVACIPLYIVVVLLVTRRPRRTDPVLRIAPDARAGFLLRIDEIEAKVRAGELAARGGHQRLSEVVRAYVEQASGLPASTMSLADFRLRAVGPLVEAIEVMYPPEFAPDDDGGAREQFDAALAHARGVIGAWT